MHHRLSTALVAAGLLVSGCGGGEAPPPPAPAGTGPDPAAVMARGLAIADRYKVAAITSRRLKHESYWQAIAPSLQSPRLTVEEVGRSIQGRPLRTITFGTGPVKILLWSQMHGDETTASMALAEIFAWLASSEEDPFRDRLASAATIKFLPMLNPDGAERFQRENAVGIDVNRDARRLSTPEAQTLKAVRDRFEPAFGFNLHDQNARTRAGRNGRQAAIALLAPPADSARTWGPVRSRARLVAAGLAALFSTEIPGRVARYDDAFNPRAFGDLMQSWGTSLVLIESGAMPDDPEKQALRRLHVAAILGALEAIATGSYAFTDPSIYERLAINSGGAYDVLVRGGAIVLPGKDPLRADLAINYDDAVARTGGRVREVGDLSTAVAIDTVDATGGFLHPRPEALVRDGAASWLRVGATAAIDLRSGADPASPLIRKLD